MQVLCTMLIKKVFIITIVICYLTKSVVSSSTAAALNVPKNTNIKPQLSNTAPNKLVTLSTSSYTPVKQTSTYEKQGSFPLLPLKSVSPFPDSKTKSTKISPSWSI